MRRGFALRAFNLSSSHALDGMHCQVCGQSFENSEACKRHEQWDYMVDEYDIPCMLFSDLAQAYATETIPTLLNALKHIQASHPTGPIQFENPRSGNSPSFDLEKSGSQGRPYGKGRLKDRVPCPHQTCRKNAKTILLKNMERHYHNRIVPKTTLLLGYLVTEYRRKSRYEL